MEHIQQQKKPQQKIDRKSNRTEIPQPSRRVYSEKQENLGVLAYTQEDKTKLRIEQEGYLQHKLAHIVQQKRDFAKLIVPTDNSPVQEICDLEQMTDNKTAMPRMQQDCTEVVIQRIPTPGEVAAVRFSQLANWELIQKNIKNQDIIQQELIDVGILQNIAQNIAQNVEQNIEANYLATLPNHKLSVITNCFSNLIQSEYNQLTRDNFGVDYNPNEQAAPLLTILTETLMTHYFPLININSDTVDPDPIQPDPIQVKIRGQQVQNMQKQIKEGVRRINRLLNPNMSQQLPRGCNLPEVDIYDTDFGGVTDSLHDINGRGRQEYGLGAGPSQVAHEQGHHIENYLGVNDFVNLHYYLYRHANPNSPDRVSGWNKLLGFTKDAGMGGPGYNIRLPEMKFQNIISRNLSSGNGVARFGLFNAGNVVLCKLFSLFGAQKRGQRFIDDFFLQESNSNSTSYASNYDPQTYETEFMSTTAELLSTVRGAQEVIDKDPTRVVLFIYLTNRPLYQQINDNFQQRQAQANPVTLDEFMHIINFSTVL